MDTINISKDSELQTISLDNLGSSPTNGFDDNLNILKNDDFGAELLMNPTKISPRNSVTDETPKIEELSLDEPGAAPVSEIKWITMFSKLMIRRTFLWEMIFPLPQHYQNLLILAAHHPPQIHL